MDELVEMESESGNPVSKFFFRIKAEVHGVSPVVTGMFNLRPPSHWWHEINLLLLTLLQIYLNLMKCFNYPMKENMTRLVIVWFTLSFG